ncbi:MAG: hypothetical protein ABIH39_04595 [Candidatus Margulisiibacteriota bacterium]
MRKIQITTLILLILLTSPLLFAQQNDKITFSPPSLILTAGISQKVDVLGAEEGTYSIGGFDPKIVDATLQGNVIRVQGKSNGNTIIFAVDDEGNIFGLRILIREFGAKFPYSLNTDVRGEPATEETIIEAAREAIQSNAVIKDGVTLHILEDQIDGVQPLEPGQKTLLTVPVIASGNNYTSLLREIPVIVNNLQMDYKEDDYLLMSNNPEIITKTGLLFTGQINNKESARLVYHHTNELMGTPKLLKVILENPNDNEAKVLLCRGIGGPSIDSLFVGHVATKRYLASAMNKNGIIITIPAKSKTIIAEQAINGSEESVTGIIKIWLIEGKNIIAEVHAYDSLKEELSNIDKKSMLLPLDGLKGHARGRFHPANIRVNVNVDAEKEQTVIDLGLKPELFSTDNHFKLIGNYGVIHNIHVTLINGSEQPKKIQLYCVPSGGLARGIFLVENTLLETGILDPHIKEAVSFKTVIIPPLSKKLLFMTTMPQAGSYYPVKLVFWSS